MSDQGYNRASHLVTNVILPIVKVDMKHGLDLIHALAPHLDGPSVEDMQAVRVLLTDAFMLLTEDKPGFDVHVSGSLANVWREKYKALLPKLGAPVNAFTGEKIDGSDPSS